jgi:putative flippase GtrA
MRIVNKRDIISGLVTGLTTGLIGWRVLSYLGASLPLGIDPVVLVPVTPFAWVAGVQLGYALGVVFRPFIQFGRFVAIGFSNAAVDFGVLYILIAATGLAAGVAYTVFKTISFTVATVHSYYWNKTWAFDASSSGGGAREVASFIAVAVGGLLVNVGVASLVVALRPAGFVVQSWAGIGAIAGAAAAIIISFTGFRVFVFKKK